MLPYNDNLKQLSRQLRNNMTDTERYLSKRIRMKLIKGCQFYRQKPIGDYIVDFFCPKARLAIEIDGSRHSSSEATEYDRIRDEYLMSLSLRVLRFSNTEVMKNIEGVIERIMKLIPLSPPFTKGETRHNITSPFHKEETKHNDSSPFYKGRVRGI